MIETSMAPLSAFYEGLEIKCAQLGKRTVTARVLPLQRHCYWWCSFPIDSLRLRQDLASSMSQAPMPSIIWLQATDTVWRRLTSWYQRQSDFSTKKDCYNPGLLLRYSISYHSNFRLLNSNTGRGTRVCMEHCANSAPPIIKVGP